MTSLELATDGTTEFSEGNLYFIGNATTLIRFGGLTILTDTAFLHKGEHVDLGHGIWARREVEPACQIADLPPIDLVILSHYHGDHFDDVAAQELDKNLPIVSTADAVDKLSALGFQRGHSLDTWESLEVPLPRHRPRPDPHGWHDLPGHRCHDDGRTRSQGRRDHQTSHRHPDPLQRLFGIPVGTRRLQAGRRNLHREHGVRLPRSWRYLHIHAQRVR